MSTDVIKLAREAWSAMAMADPGPIAYVFSRPQLERFATLVIADFLERTGQYVTNDASGEAALAAEREACAKQCDARYMGDNNREDMEARRCAAAIRARGTP